MTPTLDQLSKDPELVRGLPASVIFDLSLKAAATLVILASARAAEPATEAAADIALSTEEAATQLGISASTLRHGASSTYKGLRLENGTRKLTWSRDRIAAFMLKKR